MKIQKLSILKKYNQILKRINLKSQKVMRLKKKKVDIYNTVIWDFILAIKMCFETREKIPCTVHSLKSMRD